MLYDGKENILRYCRVCGTGRRSLPAQNPHEDELDDIRVDEEELGPSVALSTSNRVHGASTYRHVPGGIRQENILE